MLAADNHMRLAQLAPFRTTACLLSATSHSKTDSTASCYSDDVRHAHVRSSLVLLHCVSRRVQAVTDHGKVWLTVSDTECNM